MKYIFILIIASFVTACAYSSDVIKMGPNTYYVSGTAGSERGGEIGAKQVAIKEASSFCSKLGKQVSITKINTVTVNELGTGSADVTFRCIP